jgi:hypothetical protein
MHFKVGKSKLCDREVKYYLLLDQNGAWEE